MLYLGLHTMQIKMLKVKKKNKVWKNNLFTRQPQLNDQL